MHEKKTKNRNCPLTPAGFLIPTAGVICFSPKGEFQENLSKRQMVRIKAINVLRENLRIAVHLHNPLHDIYLILFLISHFCNCFDSVA